MNVSLSLYPNHWSLRSFTLGRACAPVKCSSPCQQVRKNEKMYLYSSLCYTVTLVIINVSNALLLQPWTHRQTTRARASYLMNSVPSLIVTGRPAVRSLFASHRPPSCRRNRTTLYDRHFCPQSVTSYLYSSCLVCKDNTIQYNTIRHNI